MLRGVGRMETLFFLASHLIIANSLSQFATACIFCIFCIVGTLDHCKLLIQYLILFFEWKHCIYYLLLFYQWKVCSCGNFDPKWDYIDLLPSLNCSSTGASVIPWDNVWTTQISNHQVPGYAWGCCLSATCRFGKLVNKFNALIINAKTNGIVSFPKILLLKSTMAKSLTILQYHWMLKVQSQGLADSLPPTFPIAELPSPSAGWDNRLCWSRKKNNFWSIENETFDISIRINSYWTNSSPHSLLCLLLFAMLVLLVLTLYRIIMVTF